MSTHCLLVSLLFVVGVGLVCADYHYFYPGTSYRSLCNRVKQLERKVQELQQPVHVHVDGNGDQTSASVDGTHVHVHVSVDDQEGVTPAPSDEYSYASCYVQPNSAGTSNVRGFVHMRQKPSSQIEIKTNLSGFPGAGLYGFHVHEVANFENGCNSFGGHYNPYGKVHGGPADTVRHVGDWGNIQVDARGMHAISSTDRLASLFGSESIVGRGIVIHAGTDDLGRGGDEGSMRTGNAGPRLACCAIGWTKDGAW